MKEELAEVIERLVPEDGADRADWRDACKATADWIKAQLADENSPINKAGDRSPYSKLRLSGGKAQLIASEAIRFRKQWLETRA